MEYVLLQYGVPLMSRGTQFLLFILCALLLADTVFASQYRSREIDPPTQEELKALSLSPADIELRFNEMEEGYSKASTARYLARHHLQKKHYSKAVEFYLASLSENGLSDYAQQEVYAELAQVYMLQKNYNEVLRALEKHSELGGKSDSHLLMLQAVAYLYTNNLSKAVQLADMLYQQEKRPNASFLQQLVLIYFNSESFAKAAEVQQRYLNLQAHDIEAWKLLSHIYLRLKAYDKASHALSIAWINGLRLQQEDILQLAELYAANDAPYSAARLLADAIKRQQVPVSINVLERQLRYWQLAREKERAADTLKELVSLQPSIEHYLQLAQLQMQAKQWAAMKESVTQACEIALPDEYVGKANLFLGISEYQLGNIAAARYALINATLIGGVVEEANSWLTFIEAQAADEEETQNFSGVCTPKWARTQQLALAGKKSQHLEKIGKINYQIKTNQKKTLFVGDYTLAVADLEKRLLPLVMQLGMTVAKNRGRISGPLHFIFSEPVDENSEVMSFQMAFPISKKPDMTGRYKIIEDEEFSMATMQFDQHPENIQAAWKAFVEQLLADGLVLGKEARQVIIDGEKASKERVKMELQVRVN